MCSVNEITCRARMEKVTEVDKDIQEIKEDLKELILITKNQDNLISKQDKQIALLEQQNKLMLWILGVIFVVVIGILIKYILPL